MLLSEPGRDFNGGEFVMTEQRPRMQSRADGAAAAPGRRGGDRGAPASGARHARRLPREPAPRRQPRARRGTGIRWASSFTTRLDARRRCRRRCDLFDAEPAPRQAVVRWRPARSCCAVSPRRRRPSCLRDLRAVIARRAASAHGHAGRLRMSVAMTNCGSLGWVSDASGYRYDAARPAERPAVAGDAGVVLCGWPSSGGRGRLRRRLSPMRV